MYINVFLEKWNNGLYRRNVIFISEIYYENIYLFKDFFYLYKNILPKNEREILFLMKIMFFFIIFYKKK